MAKRAGGRAGAPAGRARESIVSRNLVEEAERRYLTYAVSVITARALPDVRDGLKPVQRRILYTMGRDLRLGPDARFAKSAKVCGQVMGNYHPHGDQAIYDAMVRLAQPFSVRYPLVWGQGNFGSLDHDPPAAMRYTEAKLRPLAMELLSEIQSDTVDLRPNYDGSQQEPTVLPARVPLMLLNGGSGIAVGMATSIPPHNLGELVAACVALLKDRKAPLESLLQLVRGPDLPTGGEIVASAAELESIYRTGRGSLTVRGTWREVRDGRQRQLVIDSIPYGVQKSALVERIGELIRTRRLFQATDVRDESTGDVRIVLEIRRDADARMVMAFLRKSTQLQETLAVNLTCLIPAGNATRPVRLGLRAALVHFLDFRLVVVTRRLEFELRQLEKRIHILEGFRAVFSDLDEAIAIVRRSDGREESRAGLMATFELSEIQADAVLDTKIYRLARFEIKKILRELREKEKAARRIRGLLGSERRRWKLVETELEQVAAAHGDPRRTAIVAPSSGEAQFSAAHFIEAEDTHVILTRDGWIKRVARLSSPISTRTREGDEVAQVVIGSTREGVVFFSNLGSAYVMRIHDVPATHGYGEPVQKHFRFADGERVVCAVSLDPRALLGIDPDAEGDGAVDDEEDGGVSGPLALAVTAKGNVLRFSLAAHREVSQRGGRRYCRPQGTGDEVLFCSVVAPEQVHVVVATRKGRAIVFRVDEVSVLAGPGKGVRAIKLEATDRVVAAALSTGRGDGLRVETTRGAVHTLAATEDRLIARGGKGRTVLKREGFVRAVPEPVEVPVFSVEEGDGEGEERDGRDEGRASRGQA